MRLNIVWNSDVTEVDLNDGRVTVGGSEHDGIFLVGLPHGLLELTLEGARAQVTATRSLRIGGTLFPARIPRMLLPGESLQLPNDVSIERPAESHAVEQRRTVNTAYVTQELLLQDGTPTQKPSRAATLTCVAGADAGAEFVLGFDRCTLGRGAHVDFRLRDRAVSRSHACIKRRNRRFFLEETGDTNGLFVNAERLTAEYELRSGDVIELGQTMLRFQGPERAPDEVTVALSLASPKVEVSRSLIEEYVHSEVAQVRLRHVEPARVSSLWYAALAGLVGVALTLCKLLISLR